MSETALSQFKHRIERIYHTVNHVTDYDAITQDIMRCCHSFCEKTGRTFLDQPVEPEHERWSQEDVILITYGDSIRTEGEAPMHTLSEFLQTHLKGVINSVHILPFFPFSSDDGFSVIDYYRVNSDLGDWSDVSDIAEHFDLMADLVINHCSRENLWFIDYISNNEPYTEYFIEVDPTTDVSLVTRPRNSSLLSPVHTHRGIRHVWATFSEDQIDLNFANPAVLIEFVKIYLFYIEQGSRFIRLDAVGFLWKKIGTTCIHLPETHEAVKLLRDIINFVAPEVVVITETNVPVKENLSYFGDSDEAHMVYQFGLPPLVLHALNRGNASFLSEWTQSIPPLPTGCTYLNFTASHDGIGVRPVEGLLPEREVHDLIDSMHRFGGFVSMKANSDGTESPYEINITMFDACMGTRRGVDHHQVQRFLCSQAIMLGMQGIPALYIHSLTASPNDLAHVEQTGRTRSINRRIWDKSELDYLLNNPVTSQAEVFNALKRMVAIRCKQPAFHPGARQQVIKINSDIYINKRTSLDGDQRIFAISNVTERQLVLPLASLGFLESGLTDVLAHTPTDIIDELVLHPYQTVWLSNKRD